MVEIILALVAALQFGRVAKRINKNRLIWIVIGLLSYFVPAILFRSFAYPYLISNLISRDNYIIIIVFGILSSTVVGGSSCYAAYKFLMSRITDKEAFARDTEAARKFYDVQFLNDDELLEIWEKDDKTQTSPELLKVVGEVLKKRGLI